MTITTGDIKGEYIKGYKTLQTEWKKKDKELVLVGRLAYWTFWVSKLAETSNTKDERKQLFTLKTNGLILLAKSDYTQIRQYIPRFHKQLCHHHYARMKRFNINTHLYIYRMWGEFEKCTKCQKGIEHYYTLYSVAVLNEKEDIDGRKPLYVLYAPYILLKDKFPELDSLKSVKKYYGSEQCETDIDKYVNKPDTQVFSFEMVFKYFTKNYNELSEFLKTK